MAATDPIEQIKEWAAADPRTSVNDDGTLALAGDPVLTVSVSSTDDRVTLSYAHDAPGASASVADAAIGALRGRRGTLVEGSAKVTTEGVTVTLESPIYLDGLSRDAFARALQDLAAETDTVLTAIEAAPAAAQPDSHPEETAGPEVAEAEADLMDVTREVQRTGAWHPTHQVPSGGLQAWPRPDPSLESSAELQPRVQLAIAERRGDWARVVGSNGWTGWVDARRLATLDLAGGTAAAPAGGGTVDLAGLKVYPLPLVAAIALIIATFLPWLDITGTGVSENAMDLPLASLWNYDVDLNAPYIGWLTLILAAGGVAAAVVATRIRGLVPLVGTLAIVAGLAFIGQAIRFALDFDAEVVDAFTDVLGFGPYVAIAAGVIMLAGRKS